MDQINLADYEVPETALFEGTLWIPLDEHCSVPSDPQARPFYIPRRTTKPGWAEKLERIYGVSPWFVLDPAISNLPNEIPFEELERERLEYNQGMFNTKKDPTPLPTPGKVDPLEYLQTRRLVLAMRVDSEEKWNKLTDFDKRVMRWRRDYGLLWDHRFSKDVLFPMVNPEYMKYEIDREFYFRIPVSPGLVLSLAREINSERAIYGFRKEGYFDTPFDMSLGRVEQVIGSVDRLTRYLEKIVNE